MKSPKTSLLFIFSAAGIGGIEVAWRDIIKRIHGDFEIRVLFWLASGPLLNDYRRMGVEVETLGAARNRYFAAIRLFRELRRSRREIVITSGVYPDMLVRLFRCGGNIKRYVTLVPGLTRTLSIPKIRIRLLDLTSGLVDVYLFNSENNARLYRMYPRIKPKIQVMKLGIDYLDAAEAESFFLSRESRQDYSLRLACVANMTPVKNHLFLIELFARYKKQLSGVRLVLVGKGPLKAGLQERCRVAGLKNIEFLENISNIYEVLLDADGFIFASHVEGTPMAIMEAMNAGLPVIAYQNGPYSGVDELVLDNQTGFLMQTLDMEAWLEAISTLTENREMRRQMGRVGRERVKPYALATVVQSVRQMIQNWMAP